MATINQAAWAFGASFVAEGLLVAVATLPKRLRFARSGGPIAALGWAGLGWILLAYAMVAYPLLGLLAGMRYPAMPTFGVTPCPLVIFTWGLLLLARPAAPKHLVLVPLLWSLIGGSAALLLEVRCRRIGRCWPAASSPGRCCCAAGMRAGRHRHEASGMQLAAGQCMSSLHCTAGRHAVLALAGASLALAGCAGLKGPSGCPDIAGTYANQAEGSRQHLSALLLPTGTGNASRTVTLSLAGEPRRLVVAAGAQHATLEPSQDFTCESGVLRLAEPLQHRINLGSFLTQDVETVLTLSKDADAGLVATTSTREHSLIWGKSVTGALHPGAVLHWKAVAAPQDR